MEWALYLLLGSVAGTLAGLFGVGGGVIIVPILLFVFGLLEFADSSAVHLAVGTSLASIVFTSLGSMRAHHLPSENGTQYCSPQSHGHYKGSVKKIGGVPQALKLLIRSRNNYGVKPKQETS